VRIEEEVLEVAKTYLSRFKRVGSDNILGVCPFHRKADGSEERRPSFAMSLTKGVYFCFSCHERGNLKTFLRNVGVSPTTIEVQYGLLIEEIAERNPQPIDPGREPITVGSVLPESLLGIFQTYVPVDLIQDGFDPNLLHELQVGFDTTHNRITYPLRDLEGNLVGISGRTTTGEIPRYKIYDREFVAWGLPPKYNTVEKKKLLWNAHRVFPVAFNQDNPLIVLVEGFKACIWVLQSGISNTVALLGSFLTPHQQWILEQLGGTVCLMLDNNPAGIKGTFWAGRRLSKSLNVTVADYYKEQPDYLRPEDVIASIKNANQYHKWLIDNQEVTNEFRKRQTSPSEGSDV